MSNDRNGDSVDKKYLCKYSVLSNAVPGTIYYDKYNCTLQHKRCQLSEKYMDMCALYVKGDELITE
ncbi:MAG: hypothetical protein LBP57_02700 [Endomicrobium sp.]|jgi:hypothetical protein|nr:hypothetical protein [Endomicrobium sp.]